MISKVILMVSMLLMTNLLVSDGNTDSGIHDFSIQALNSEEIIDLKDFAGKKILFVNVASRCGFTPQYKGLEKLYQTYKDQLVVIGLPCNQFMWQESGSEESIAKFCSASYGVTFPMTTKINVKGRSQHPIYKWLTDKDLNGKDNFKVKWNFNKFLVDENGGLVAHYGSSVHPMDDSIVEHLEN